MHQWTNVTSYSLFYFFCFCTFSFSISKRFPNLHNKIIYATFEVAVCPLNLSSLKTYQKLRPLLSEFKNVLHSHRPAGVFEFLLSSILEINFYKSIITTSFILNFCKSRSGFFSIWARNCDQLISSKLVCFENHKNKNLRFLC